MRRKIFKRKFTVRRRIFVSNTLMVILTLVIFLVINFFVIRTYMGSMEQEFRATAQRERDWQGGREEHDRKADDIDEFVEQWTVERDEFYLAFAGGGIVCIVSLVVISQVFTRNLTRHIMKPLDALEDGTKRVRENNLAEPIYYRGDLEFENVCQAFNDMQASLLSEQEQNRRYEKARTDMIAGISHDLRTPLTAIRGTIKGLMDGVAADPGTQRKFLETAYRRTGDMDVLLGQLLYLSRMETGNVRLDMQPVALSSYLEEYVRTRQDALALSGTGPDQIRLQLDLPEQRAQGGGEMVRLDPEQFARILDNLFTNSRNYAQTQPLVITIGLATEDGHVRIRFHDNGIGVPEEKLPHIFEEFYRGDESRNRTKGNGLGLYIVHYLTQAMGGSVTAYNEDGFTVQLEFPLMERIGSE